MSKSHSLLKFLRKVHLYLGLFISPALLFFAFTGVLQTFSLHETTQGSSYKPPAWIASLAQLHKKQTTVVPPRRPRPTFAPAPDLSKPDSTKHDHSRSDAANAYHPKADGASDKSAAPAVADRPKGPDQPAPQQKSHLPMKIFFLIVGIGLFLSTITGIYMAYKYNQSKLLVTGLLLAGTILPLLLLPF
ncbi:MAG TPA: PepSY domain-containing protein [Acidobacteriaceae bacterium]|jgi:hypothetical protein|nr:PepSY domain-containing protein [Acidobacteriaceae bacterium]